LTKRGRPKKPPAPKRDEGTPEVQLRRMILTGTTNDQRASYPLGILLAHKVIDQQQHNDALHYAHTLQMATGRWQHHEGGRAGGYGEGSVPAHQEWQKLAKRLLSLGRRYKDAMDNVAVFERLPSWAWALIQKRMPSKSEVAAQKDFVRACDALAGMAVDRVSKAA